MTPRGLLIVVICLVWFGLCAFASLTMQAAERWLAIHQNSARAKPWYVRFWAWTLGIDGQ
jgi:hypothetical protein